MFLGEHNFDSGPPPGRPEEPAAGQSPPSPFLFVLLILLLIVPISVQSLADIIRYFFD